MQDIEKLFHKKFNAEIRELQLKHREEIEKLKAKQFDLMQNILRVCEYEPIRNELVKILKA